MINFFIIFLPRRHEGTKILLSPGKPRPLGLRPPARRAYASERGVRVHWLCLESFQGVMEYSITPIVELGKGVVPPSGGKSKSGPLGLDFYY